MWHKFTILLREIKRAPDPTLGLVLSKIRQGICDNLSQVLQTRLHKQDMDTVDLDKTVIICATRGVARLTTTVWRRSLDQPVNMMLMTPIIMPSEPLDHQRIQHRERLPDKL